MKLGFMKLFGTALLCAGLASGASAKDYNWTGGGAAGTWNDAANWGNAGIPGGGDRARFPESIGSACKITITDEVVVSSGTLTIWSASTYAIDLDFAGGFSGAGSLSFDSQKGTITLSHASTLTGDVTIGGRSVYVSAQDALGSGDGTVNILSYNSPLVVTAGMTIANPIHVKLAQKNEGTVEHSAIRYIPTKKPDTLTFSGKITVDNGFCFSIHSAWGSGLGDQTVNFGPIDGLCEEDNLFKFNGTTISGNLTYNFNGVINAPKSMVESCNGVLSLKFNAAGNDFRYLYFDRGTQYITVTGALPTNCLYRGDTYYVAETVKFTGGTEQTFRGFDYSRASVANNGSVFTVDGSSRVRLTARAQEKQKCYQNLQGLLDFVWAPEGDYELQMPDKAVTRTGSNTTTGTLVASNGTLRLTKSFAKLTAIEGYNAGRFVLDYNAAYKEDGLQLTAVKTVKLADSSSFACDNTNGLPALTSLTLENGSFSCTAVNGLTKLTDIAITGTGVVDLGRSVGLPEASSVSLTTGCSLRIADTTLTTPSATLDGEPLAGGYYTKDGRIGTKVLAELGPETVLYVKRSVTPLTPQPSVWTGAAGNGRLFDAGNWEGSTLPAFASGAAYLVFSGDAEVTLDQPCKISGLKADGGTLTIVKADTGALELLPGTSLVTNGANVVFGPDVTIVCGHTVNMDFSTVIRFNGTVHSENNTVTSFMAPKLTKDSPTTPPRVYFTTPSDAKCDYWFENVFVTAKGANPLGCGFGAVTIRNMAGNDAPITYDAKFYNLELDNAVISNQVTLYHYEATFDRMLVCLKATTNTIAGAVDCSRGKSRYVEVLEGSLLTLAGGLTYKDNNFYTSCSGSGAKQGVIVVKDNPLRFSNSANINKIDSYPGYNYRLETAGNEIRNLKFEHAQSRMTIAAADAIANTLLKSMKNGTLDLNGFDTTFTGAETTAAAGIVTSAAPACLVYDGSRVSTNAFALVDKAGFIQKGTGTTRMTTAQTSSGTLGAAGNGTVVLASTSAWRGDLSLADHGTLTVESGATLKTRRSNLSVTGTDWTLALPGDVTVKHFYKNGVEQPGGVYGPDGNITGGSLIVRGNSGAVILVR